MRSWLQRDVDRARIFEVDSTILASHMQVYLTDQKTHPPRTLPLAYA